MTGEEHGKILFSTFILVICPFLFSCNSNISKFEIMLLIFTVSVFKYGQQFLNALSELR